MALTSVASAYTSNTVLVASIIALGTTAYMVHPAASLLPAEILGSRLAGVGFGITNYIPKLRYSRSTTPHGVSCRRHKIANFKLHWNAVFSATEAIFAYTLKTN